VAGDRAAALEGKLRFEEIAKEVGVARETLWRWRKNPAFRVALARLRAVRHQRRVDRFWRLQDRAFDVAEESLDEGDPRMAIDLIRLGARGLRDLDEEDEPSESEAPADGMEDADGPPADAGVMSAEGFRCAECGRETKSKRGPTQHVKRVHGS
jgi:hypothetical protein